MKQEIQSLIAQAITTLQGDGVLPNDINIDIKIERTRDERHGDFACNIALMLAKQAKTNPRELANQIVSKLPGSPHVQKTDIAGPGFINFTLADDVLLPVVSTILEQGENFGCNKDGDGKRVHIEFVSANPTGPLHVGHGRGAAYGACVANLLRATSFKVHCEYYVNDAGRQMRILALSVWLRYLELFNEPIALPKNAYQGDYVQEVAGELKNRYDRQFFHTWDAIQAKMPENLDPETDKEGFIDAMVSAAQSLLGDADFQIVHEKGLNSILNDIKDDLGEFGVHYEEWFRESHLFDMGWLNEGVDLLKEHGHTYEKDNTLWFRGTELGDDKDRVLVRSNGQPTYFASDVAYHLYKYNQGYDQIIDIFGSDHHGYIGRIRGFLTGLGKNPDKLSILLVQFAILYRGKEKVSMSTRSGEFVTLRELRYEVGNDAARYFYIMRRPEQHLDFDLELAKSQSNENPVYYIQYAHARICSVWRQLESSDWQRDDKLGLQHLEFLTSDHEKNLLTTLTRYPEMIATAANRHEPHLLAHYLQDIAAEFHSYYNASKFLVDDEPLRNARLVLVAAIQQVITNGLKLLGLSAPEMM